MNFHSWGNLWIYPYNFFRGDDKEIMKIQNYDFYYKFTQDLKNKGFYNAGTAINTIQYVANGEASDWMLGVHDIISFSPEMGSKENTGGSFYPNKNQIKEVMSKEFLPIDLFLDYCIVKFNDIEILKTDDQNLQNLLIKNLSINSLE